MLCSESIARQIRKHEYKNQLGDEKIVERQSALGIANAIRL